MSLTVRRSSRLAASTAVTSSGAVTATIAQSEVKSEVTDPATEKSPLRKRKRENREAQDSVYDIPDVERRQTTFTGRLGYACLNTILRNKKPASQSVFCSRTCRIDTMKKNGMVWVKNLGKQNLRDMLTIIKWNEENNIRFMRLSSNIFPFASHGQYGYSLFDEELVRKSDSTAPADAEEAAKEDKGTQDMIKETIPELLAQVGALAQQYGHRLTSHPGQFVQLASPNPKVRESSIRELVYHAEMMEGMGLDQDSVMIVHGGGTYNDKAATLERMKTTIRNELPKKVRDRLVLENDELCYAAEDLLPLCEELHVPLVFDYHHHNLNPCSKGPIPQTEEDAMELDRAQEDSAEVADPEDDVNPFPSEDIGTALSEAGAPVTSEVMEEKAPLPTLSIPEILARTNAIFKRRGIRPKQHLSEPRTGAVTLMEKRAHADRCERMPEVFDEGYEGEAVDTNVDLMIEAKDKEQAVLHLYRVYGLCEVKQESLRPAGKETKETKGRKSNKRAKAMKEKIAVSEGDVEMVGKPSVDVEADPNPTEETKPRKRARKAVQRLNTVSAELNGDHATEDVKKKGGKERRGNRMLST